MNLKKILTVAALTVITAAFFGLSACQSQQDDQQETGNLFAAPLDAYFAGGVEGLRLPQGISMFDTWARFVDVDGAGTRGVLALRYELRDDWPTLVARVFYELDGEVFYLDIDSEEHMPMVITKENRIVKSIATGRQDWSYTLFGIENGRLAPVLTIYVRIDNVTDHESDGDFHHYLYRGDWRDGLENREPITKEAFDEIHSDHGLDYLNSPWGLDDQQDLIRSTD